MSRKDLTEAIMALILCVTVLVSHSGCPLEHAPMIKKDYYVILGVPRSESPAGIHDAFRRLAKLHHPDLGGPETTEAFQEIAQAYEVLSDPEQRITYDRTLRQSETFLRPGPLEQSRPQARYRPEPLVPQPISILHDFETIRLSFDALFDCVLRDYSGGGPIEAEPIKDLNIGVIVSPMEAASGMVARIEIPGFRTCWSCHGTGREWLFSCVACTGRGLIEQHQTVSVRIPPGIRDQCVIERPIGSGMCNFYLRLHIRIRG